MDDLHHAIDNVIRHHTGHIHGVLRAGERRSVSMLDFLHVIDAFPVFEDVRQHVGTFIHSVKTDNLTAQELPIIGTEDDLDGQRKSVRIVSGMR
ncbi:hypothetical protein DSECCO2_653960 [anaerobic digester metagenome]